RSRRAPSARGAGARGGNGLPQGEARDARIGPLARGARPARFGGSNRIRRDPRDEPRGSGALRRGARAEDRDPLAPPRLRAACLRRSRSGPIAMMSLTSRPRLAAKARLRFDRKTERTMILFPEKGLELSPTAADVVHL